MLILTANRRSWSNQGAHTQRGGTQAALHKCMLSAIASCSEGHSWAWGFLIRILSLIFLQHQQSFWYASFVSKLYWTHPWESLLLLRYAAKRCSTLNPTPARGGARWWWVYGGQGVRGGGGESSQVSGWQGISWRGRKTFSSLYTAPTHEASVIGLHLTCSSAGK